MIVKKRIIRFLICSFLLGLAFAASASELNDSKVKAQTQNLEPRQQQRMAMAPRLKDLDGKTIFIVDVGYPKTQTFIKEIRNVLKEKYPETNWVIKSKTGSYFDDDPALWQEIKEKGHGMIMAIGH